MHIVHVVGARPNFMKIAPIIRAMSETPGIRQTLVHTGQHYDRELSQRFFEDLGLPAPDLNLEIGSDTPSAQLGRMLIALEPVFAELAPDWVVTVGDVTSTLAAALVATRGGLAVAHVEAGLRSGDWRMPEEVNRVLTDRLSDVLFTTEPSAVENLRREGIDPARVHAVGNVMIDTLDRLRPRAAALDMPAHLGLEPGAYVLATLHRPQNVDDPERLEAWMEALAGLGDDPGVEVVFPVHPRTRARLEAAGLEGALDRIRALRPLGYLEFLGLLMDAGAAVTDSGGIQEEATVLGVPCLTLRPNTERPVTIEAGTNRLFTGGPRDLAGAVIETLARPRTPVRPDGWDGHAAERIAGILRATEPVARSQRTRRAETAGVAPKTTKDGAGARG